MRITPHGLRKVMCGVVGTRTHTLARERKVHVVLGHSYVLLGALFANNK